MWCEISNEYLKGTVPRRAIESPLSLFPNYTAKCRKNPNELDKKILQSKLEQVFWKEAQDYKDGSGLRFIKFDFVTGCQEIKPSIPVDEIRILSHIFFLFS